MVNQLDTDYEWFYRDYLPYLGMTADVDPRCQPVVDHVSSLTFQAHLLLLQVIQGQSKIPAAVGEEVQEWDRRHHGYGWVRWLCQSVPHRALYVNYPQVAANALYELKRQCQAPDLLPMIESLRAEFERVANSHPWVCMAAQPVASKYRGVVLGVPYAPRQRLSEPGAEVQPAGAIARPRDTTPEMILPKTLSAPDLARFLEQPVSRVESFLRAYRENHADCYVTVNNARKNEPRYLYRTEAVWPALQDQLPRWRTLGPCDAPPTDG